MTKQTTHYWFKRRRYGYGWIPVRWQGWVILALCLLAIIGAAVILVNNPYSNESLWAYLNIVITAVAFLVIVAIIKGPRPKWRWGKKPSDNSKEDF